VLLLLPSMMSLRWGSSALLDAGREFLLLPWGNPIKLPLCTT
jgi:hypothetical protein